VVPFVRQACSSAPQKATITRIVPVEMRRNIMDMPSVWALKTWA
jgi:hypothetical protein